MLGRLRDHPLFKGRSESGRKGGAGACGRRCRPPNNRGTLCPKGAAIKDFALSPTRATKPRYRAPGGADWQDITWDQAFDKIARAIKDDRDANLIETNDQGQKVNRWKSMGFLAASGTTNETAWLTYKAVRALGVVGFDNQARV